MSAADPSRPTTEQPNPATARLDELATRELVRVMNDEDARVAPAVARELDAIARAIDAIAARLRDGGRLVYLGAGTSGRLGVLDASECPPTFGVAAEQVVGLIAGGEPALVRSAEGAEDDRELALADLARVELGAKDALVGISASGRTPYVLAAVARARELGALTVGLSCNAGSPLSTAVEIPITPVPGPEVVTGSTRLKAGTATKLVLNLLSTGVMVRLGRVRGNLMVDLAASNSKLEARARGIIAQLTGLGEAEAAARLAEHGGDVRAAVAGPRAAPAVALDDWVLGLDGGGTKTVARLAPRDAGTTGGEGRGGPCNLTTSLDLALRSIDAAVAAAFAAAGMRRAPVPILCLAAAGSGAAELRARLRAQLVARAVARTVLIVPDAAAVLAAAAPEVVGIALVAGTGSLAFARRSDGHVARAGGFGPAIGDGGSAHELGRAALRIAAATADGRRGSTRLHEIVLAHFRVADARALAGRVREATPMEIAALAPRVVAAAQEGDACAGHLLDLAAAELAELVLAAGRKLELWPSPTPLPLAVAGGLLTAEGGPHGALLARLQTELERRALTVTVQIVADPVAGALQIARMHVQRPHQEADWFPP